MEMEETVHIRRSERVRRQRYNIHPDDIGNDDDKTDQDYIQKDEKRTGGSKIAISRKMDMKM